MLLSLPGSTFEEKRPDAAIRMKRKKKWQNALCWLD
jgi:hypothetical protein